MHPLHSSVYPAIILFLGLLVTGCASRTAHDLGASAKQDQETERVQPSSGDPESRDPSPRREAPRTVASLELVQAGRELLSDGRPDQAIRMLERAVNLSPGNGQAYYYLAEAWLMKDAPDQAAEFNRLALIHLEEDTRWSRRVQDQAEKIRSWWD